MERPVSKLASGHLRRMSWISALVLGGSVLPIAFLLLRSPSEPTIPFSQAVKSSILPTELTLPLQSEEIQFSIGQAQESLIFSVDPPRPYSKAHSSSLLVQLARSRQWQRVSIPSQVGLAFDDAGILRFTPEGQSQFWLQIESEGEGRLSGALHYRPLEGDPVCGSRWAIELKDTPLLTNEDPSLSNSPFRQLAEGRWWGRDLFLEKYGHQEGGVHTLEFGSSLKKERLPLSLKDWLVFKEGCWQKTSSSEDLNDYPIARVRGELAQGLEIEGWEGSSHVRLKMEPVPLPPLRMKTEELFGQLRVRSEKQMSCTLEKNCLVLKPGDWVLKLEQRWKVLRRKEDRDAYLKGELAGDLFVLDAIENKGKLKKIRGNYFSSERFQMIPVEFSPETPKASSRGKHKGSPP